MNEFLELAVTVLVAAPAIGTLLLGVSQWAGVTSSETVIARTVAGATVAALLAAMGLAIAIGVGETHTLFVDLGRWFSVGEYEFRWALVADPLSITFSLFAILLVGVIGSFSRRYLHREPGFYRFYLLLALFSAGVQIVVLAGSLDLVFFGWEIVGVTSALLIAFFVERPGPARNGFRAFVTYRACDVGLLAAAVLMHHSAGSSGVEMMMLEGEWAGWAVPTSEALTTGVGLALLWASMGKAAQMPLGGWLPRAMEGPTPSSAIFYGAISIHLGPYLLLRSAPILAASPAASWATGIIGGLTALHATFVGRAQTDIKSALAYASMTQVGIIFVEIALGFHTLALVHIVGHAAIRSAQILRSPSLLRDHQQLEQRMGEQLSATGRHLEWLMPKRVQAWLYRAALERGYFDAVLTGYVVGGLVRGVKAIDEVDQRWTDWLSRVGGGGTDVDPDAHRDASKGTDS